VSDFNPSSELKLEGGMSAGDALMAGAASQADASAGDYAKIVGMRLPGEPKPIDPSTQRDTLSLVTASPLGRRAPKGDDDCLALARQSYESSENYFNAAHRNRIIDAMARYNNEHPKGSKYNTEAFQRRSRLFRPKTRSSIRKRESAACIALFGSADIVNVTPSNNDAGSALDARIQESLLNYRLQQDDRWYKFIIGAVQDADRQGFAIAKTSWEYEEANRYYDELLPNGSQRTTVDTVAIKDRPGYTLIPVERLRFSPATDWIDPVNSSPYLIEVIPMFLCDVRKYMNNPRARLKYRNLSTSELLSGGHSGEWDAIRMQRERNRLNRYDRDGDPSDYSVCWVHRNIVRLEGEDYVFDTVGTAQMLSEIIPLSEFDPRGYRPYVIGATMIESHNPFQVGAATLMGGLQDEINDLSNLRVDANKMATSGRMFIKRNTAVDLHALARFSPGSVVEMDNPQTDVKWDRSPEAPAGAFEENNLLGTELDDLIGNFNSSSVAHNRNLNETVGGIEMIGDSANQITEYDIHTLVTTFVQKVLVQILDLEKRWETDANLAQIIGTKLATSAKQFWSALNTETQVLVNVGFGSTNPGKRMQRIVTAVQTTAQIFPITMYQSNQSEILKEVWAAAGFADATRFFPFLDNNGQPDKDPKVAALQQQMQSMQMQLYPGAMHNQGLIQREQIRMQGFERIQQMKSQAAMALQKAESDTAWAIKHAELQIAFVDLQLQHEQNDVARGQLMLNREKLSNDITVQRLELQLAQLTAMASPSPPQIGLDPTTQSEVSNLQAPGSNIGQQPPFQQDVASAGDYLSATKQPPAAIPPPGTNTNMPNLPLFVPPASLGTPPDQQTNV
jgi:hypothetical protein